MYRRQWLLVSVTGVVSGCLRLTDEESGSESGSSDSFEVRDADADGSLQMALDRTGVAAAGRPQENPAADAYTISITLTESAAERLVDALESIGAFAEPAEHPIVVFFNREEVHSFQLSPDLVSAMRSGAFLNDPTLVIAVEDQAVAQDLSGSLRQ